MSTWKTELPLRIWAEEGMEQKYITFIFFEIMAVELCAGRDTGWGKKYQR